MKSIPTSTLPCCRYALVLFAGAVGILVYTGWRS